jgi:hypothetical protein
MTGMLSDEHQRWLEEDRGFDLEIVTRYGVFTDRQSPGGRDLAFPFIRDGKLINHKYRGSGKDFRQDKDAPRALYNEDCLRDPTLADHPCYPQQRPQQRSRTRAPRPTPAAVVGQIRSDSPIARVTRY